MRLRRRHAGSGGRCRACSPGVTFKEFQGLVKALRGTGFTGFKDELRVVVVPDKLHTGSRRSQSRFSAIDRGTPPRK